jgi:hypothetical protein
VLLDKETRKEIGELASTEYLDRLLADIIKRKLDSDRARAAAFRDDESPKTGSELADFVVALQEMDISDRTLSLHYVVKLLGESIVELIAENNRRLLRLLSK